MTLQEERQELRECLSKMAYQLPFLLSVIASGEKLNDAERHMIVHLRDEAHELLSDHSNEP